MRAAPAPGARIHVDRQSETRRQGFGMRWVETAEVVEDGFRQRQICLLDPEHNALGLKVGAVFGVMRPVRELLFRVGPQRGIELHAQGVEIDEIGRAHV